MHGGLKASGDRYLTSVIPPASGQRETSHEPWRSSWEPLRYSSGARRSFWSRGGHLGATAATSGTTQVILVEPEDNHGDIEASASATMEVILVPVEVILRPLAKATEAILDSWMLS